ncbi:11736_t:CDS:1, partial [Dentiscutata heterogama]
TGKEKYPGENSKKNELKEKIKKLKEKISQLKQKLQKEKERKNEIESWSLWIEDMNIENHELDILKEKEYKFKQSIQNTPIKNDKIKIINNFTNKIYEISEENSDINDDINEIVETTEENSNSETDKEENSETSELEIINFNTKNNSFYDYNYFNFNDFNNNVIMPKCLNNHARLLFLY